MANLNRVLETASKRFAPPYVGLARPESNPKGNAALRPYVWKSALIAGSVAEMDVKRLAVTPSGDLILEGHTTGKPGCKRYYKIAAASEVSKWGGMWQTFAQRQNEEWAARRRVSAVKKTWIATTIEVFDTEGDFQSRKRVLRRAGLTISGESILHDASGKTVLVASNHAKAVMVADALLAKFPDADWTGPWEGLQAYFAGDNGRQANEISRRLAA